MNSNFQLVSDKIEYILTDIEGTTTSVSFVYDVLFPYFREHIWELKNMTDLESVDSAMNETKEIVLSEEGIQLETSEQIIQMPKSTRALGRIVENEGEDAFLVIDEHDNPALQELLSSEGVWHLENNAAVFTPFSEHPQFVRGYN